MLKIRKMTSLVLILMLILNSFPIFAAQEHGALWIEGAEGVTLTYWAPIDATSAQYYESYADHPFFKWMEEQTGIHVEFIHPSYEQMEQQFNLMVASGNYYDMLFLPSYPDGPQAAITDGIYADIAKFEPLMPNYFNAIRCNDGSFSAWEWGEEKALYDEGPQPAFVDRLTTAQGNIWCVSQVWTDALPTECGMLIRQDWLDEAGLAIPQTIEELEKVLEAFKARGNYVIPMSLGKQGVNSDNGAIISAFGIYPAWFTATDGTVNPVGWTTPEFKAYAELMSRWYKLGYIDPDFMNREYEALEALLLSDRLGIIATTWAAPDYFEKLYEGSQKGFKMSAMPLPRMNHEQVLPYRQYFDSAATNYTCIAAAGKHKEIAAQWLDKLFSKEAALRANYGVEGESYVLDEKGIPYFTEWFYNHPEGKKVDDLRVTYLFPNLSNYWSTRASALCTAPGTSMEIQKTKTSSWHAAASIWGSNAVPKLNIGYVVFDGDGWGKMYDQYVEADTYALPMVLKFITGAEDLKDFDAFAQKALDMGYKGARDAMQAAYELQHHGK